MDNNNIIKKRSRSKFRVPKFDPNTDDHISFLQVVYGEYVNTLPKIERVWVYEKYRFSILKGEELKPDAFYNHPDCGRRVCGTVIFETRTKLEIGKLQKVKEKEFKIALAKLTGWNLFTSRPSKEEMLVYIQEEVKKNTKKKN